MSSVVFPTCGRIVFLDPLQLCDPSDYSRQWLCLEVMCGPSKLKYVNASVRSSAVFFPCTIGT